MSALRLVMPRPLMAALALAAFGALASAQAPDKLPSARELMEKHDAAIGGRAALDKHTSMHQVGTLAIAAMSVDAPMDVYKAKPGKFLQKIVVQGTVEVSTGFDGKTAWAIQPGQGPIILDGAMADQVKYNADFFASFHDMSRYKSAETVGLVDFEGRKCYKVKIERAQGGEGVEYFDAATGLQAGSQSTIDGGPMGKIDQTTVFSDYQDFGGLKGPTKIVQRGGPYEVAINIKSVEFDTVPATMFDLPDAVKAIVKP
jgi:hypothetical protein